MDIKVRLNKNFTTQYNKMLAEYGEEFAKGNKFEKLAEGVMTSKALMKLAKEKGIDFDKEFNSFKQMFRL